jgi:hypothetical protein
VAWEIMLSKQVRGWYAALPERERVEINKTIGAIRESGPALRRPLVGTISGSHHHNMREARSVGGNLRVLFAFDPRRRAVMLVGGDKTGQWKQWYRSAIPQADRTFTQYLRGGTGWGNGRSSGGRTP